MKLITEKARKSPKKPTRKRTPHDIDLLTNSNRMVRIHLADRHSINGAIYGPGEVHVSRKLSLHLLSQDERSVDEEMRFRSSGRAFVVGPARRGTTTFGVVAVRPDYFEAEVNAREPALVDPR